MKKTKQYPIEVEVYKQAKSKLIPGLFIGFWVGYAPFIIHQMQWLR
tara:strand:+ start:203 stop:340 length:138 start_codon:yes stop_codon:yes gene_type:complete